MKRMTAFLLAGVLVLTLAGCSQAPKTMQFAPAALSKDEEEICALMGNESLCIFDFSMDDTARSVITSAYELGEDGKWQVIKINNMVLSDTEGRIAISFEEIPNGVRTTIQSESQGTSSKNRPAEIEIFSEMYNATVCMSQPLTVEYGKEYPVCLQVFTTGGPITAELDDFYAPEKVRALEYEHVYAVTVSFSQEELQ